MALLSQGVKETSLLKPSLPNSLCGGADRKSFYEREALTLSCLCLWKTAWPAHFWKDKTFSSPQRSVTAGRAHEIHCICTGKERKRKSMPHIFKSTYLKYYKFHTDFISIMYLTGACGSLKFVTWWYFWHRVYTAVNVSLEEVRLSNLKI